MDNNKQTLLYDVMTIPHGIDLHEVIYMFVSHAIVMYDSTNGLEPKLQGKGDRKVKFYDSSNPMKKEEFNKALRQLEDECRD